MRRSQYIPLCYHLLTYKPVEVTYSFEAIERILHRPLPDSAYGYGAWWSNHELNTQAKHGWLAADYVVADVDLENRQVRFVKYDPLADFMENG